MSDDKIMPLEDLAQEYEAAKAAYEEAERETQAARSRETECLNRLNQVQRAWDQRIDEMRQAAPRDSNWKQKRPGVPA